MLWCCDKKKLLCLKTKITCGSYGEREFQWQKQLVWRRGWINTKYKAHKKKFKFEFIVHLQTMKFITKEGMCARVSDKTQSFLAFWIFFQKNFCERQKKENSYFPTRGALENKTMWKMWRLGVESTSENAWIKKRFIELYHWAHVLPQSCTSIERTRT